MEQKVELEMGTEGIGFRAEGLGFRVSVLGFRA